MAEGTKLYNDIVSITYDYLGPAAERFVERQTTTHLLKKPSKVQKDDLDTIIRWLRVSLAFITDDEDLLNEYETRLKSLQANNHRGASHAKKA